MSQIIIQFQRSLGQRGDFMWVVRKTFDAFGGEQPFLELAVFWQDNRILFGVTIEELETKESKYCQFNSLAQVHKFIELYHPYGCDSRVSNNFETVYFIPVDDMSLKFLEYVDEVQSSEIMYNKAGGYAPVLDDSCWVRAVDKDCTFLYCNIGSGEECAGTLLNVMCYYPVLYYDGAFYMNGLPERRRLFGSMWDDEEYRRVYYKVVTSNPAAVSHFITKARTLYRNPVREYLKVKRVFDHVIQSRPFPNFKG